MPYLRVDASHRIYYEHEAGDDLTGCAARARPNAELSRLRAARQ